MEVDLIVAIARNGVIGKDNQMLWHVPEDFAHFKSTTMGHAVIMGRKTWESIGRPLPGRTNVVITRQTDYVASGAHVVPSLDDALLYLRNEARVFVIGGGEIYRQALPKADHLWVTVMDADFEGDTRFPDIDPTLWEAECLKELEPTEKRPFKVSFLKYHRRSGSCQGK